ncbi:Holliday junction branch migration protein RuvA [Alterisphingorhabdus coralli]|uniref:Holliday junction branch migration complex subunit RuvA n=1 Tax=Alterisphingorhabdus coralli TaxID=3071408 RepID=A0AA97F9Y5_9SPHN|nr:Holliday junction branch migration protein RuvA [Parasphingorhabdus sp. SCSIO 66989]WOE75762.1 Holliday junction branch migration protein RuvA [Parasphingorhabdus sp. SCSIO 66989]
MIAKLTGKLDDVDSDTAIIDVQGVGYLVHASARTLSNLGARGDSITVHTEMQVSENDMRLIGFASAAERDGFRLLISVQGVGGKVALAIQTALTPEELGTAIAQGDVTQVTRAQGVGPKLAKRIVNELKDKMGGVDLGSTGAVGTAPAGSASADAVSALTNLGFKPVEATRAVAAAEAELGDASDLDGLVKLALKKVGR